jgi:hypothetical protein
MAKDKLGVTLDTKSPEEFVMNPVLAIHTNVDDLVIDVGELKKTADSHTQLLTAILQRDTEILKEQRARRPKGKVFRKKDSAPTNDFYIIDTNKEIGPGHKARSYVVINDGPNNMFVGFNVAFSPQLDASVEDLVSDITRFDELMPGEHSEEGFDTEEIYSLHLISDPTTGLGPSNFRARMVW